MKRLSCADLIPLLRPPLSAQAVSILGFGRIESSRDQLTKVNRASHSNAIFTNRAADQPAAAPDAPAATA
jgi:hypothetical protein